MVVLSEPLQLLVASAETLHKDYPETAQQSKDNES